MNDWNGSHETLPGNGDHVQFMLIGRREPLHGIFSDQRFHARQGSFPPHTVSVWRALGGTSRMPLKVRIEPERRSWSERPMRECPPDGSRR